MAIVVAVVLVVVTRGGILVLSAIIGGIIWFLRLASGHRKAARVLEAERQNQAQMQAHQDAEQRRVQWTRCQTWAAANWAEAQRLARAQQLSGLLAGSPADFEHSVGAILRSTGYHQIDHVGGRGDRGADLIGVDGDGRRVVIQCKRYAEHVKVSSPEIQRFLGAVQIHSAQRGLLVTTSTFTKEAVAIAAEHRVDLLDGTKLVALAGTQPAYELNWFPDPQQRHAARLWDGRSWTNQVDDGFGSFLAA